MPGSHAGTSIIGGAAQPMVESAELSTTPEYSLFPQRRSSPNPENLASRLREARTSARLLQQVVDTAPPGDINGNELMRELAERCQQASAALQSVIGGDNVARTDSVVLSSIEANDLLTSALSSYHRAAIQARRNSNPTSSQNSHMTSDSGLSSAPPSIQAPQPPAKVSSRDGTQTASTRHRRSATDQGTSSTTPVPREAERQRSRDRHGRSHGTLERSSFLNDHPALRADTPQPNGSAHSKSREKEREQRERERARERERKDRARSKDRTRKSAADVHFNDDKTFYSATSLGGDKMAASGHSKHREYMDEKNDLAKIKSLEITPEMFEAMYLAPKTEVKGDLRKTFGNPTPLGLLGNWLSLTPLAIDLMGWRGAGGDGAASIGVYIFIGGVLMLISGILEFFLGNTFPFVVFCSFGGFWLSYGAVLMPSFNAAGFYTESGVDNAKGFNTAGFNASYGFFMLFMGLLCLIYLVCALRTNIVFVIVFFTLVIAFGLLSAVHWLMATGDIETANKLTGAAGAFLFICCIAGWYILAALMLNSVDFPLELPVGDISHVVKSNTEMKERRKQRAIKEIV